MKQNDAVFNAVCSVLEAKSFDSAVELTDDQRKNVISIVTQGIVSGEVDFSAEAKAKYSTPEKVRSYTSGMVSNHLRKDKRLNGNTKYEIKNPGSRSGTSDPQIKALKALKSTKTNADDIAEIDTYIEARLEALGKTKAAATVVDFSALPAELQAKYSPETSEDEISEEA